MTWDVPLRVLGGVHYLALRDGIDPWGDVPAFIADHRDWLTRFVAEQCVQTNEVQRCWALLPAFLSVADRPLELLELGPSAGLNLLWDRYRYRYAEGGWGDDDAPLEFGGEEHGHAVPRELLSRGADVRRRRGVDLDPVDVTTEHGQRLLECFVWADQPERLERLRRAIDVLRREPPELVRGDYVELLPRLLAERSLDALTVVFQTASTGYLSGERYSVLQGVLAEQAAEVPFAWISTRRRHEQETERKDGYELEAGIRPEPPRLVAHMGFHGQWLEWLA